MGVCRWWELWCGVGGRWDGKQGGGSLGCLVVLGCEIVACGGRLWLKSGDEKEKVVSS